MTYAIRISTAPDNDGKIHSGWILASHGKSLEALIINNPEDYARRPYTSLRDRIRTLKARDESRFAHLDESPYRNNLNLVLPGPEWERLVQLAKAGHCLVEPSA